MFAKIIVICIALVGAHASLIAPGGYSAPVLTAGPLAIGKGLFAAPAVATVSSQKSVINHVAPAGHVSVAHAPMALASHGILGNRLVGGHGIAAAPLAIRSGLHGADVAVGVGSLGLGHTATVSSQKSVINHVAPVAAAPLGLAGHGIVGGHGIAAAPLAVSRSLHGAPVALGVGSLDLGHGAVVSSQKSVINHVAPAAPVALASHGIYGNGIISGNGLLANGLVGGHGIAGAPLGIGNDLLGSLGHGATASSQKSVISHVAPASHGPVALANTRILSNGLIGTHGIIGNGLIAGAPLGIASHGIAPLPLAIRSGVHGSPVALGFGKAIL